MARSKEVFRRHANRSHRFSDRRAYTAAMSAVGLAAAMAGLVVSQVRRGRQGSRRRGVTGRASRAIKDQAHHAGSRGRYVSGRARGVLHRALPHRTEQVPDAQLEDRVRSTMFRDPLVSKRDITISATRGLITLDGHVRTARMAAEIERRARAIPDVESVRNLLVVGNGSMP